MKENHIKDMLRVKAMLREELSTVPQTVFERNEHGHIIITFIGLDLTGNQEIERLESWGYRVGDYAKSCFKRIGIGGYNKNHRLVAGQVYKIALVPGNEIVHSDRSTKNLRKLGKKYGYGKPLGGHIPRIRESVSDKQMDKMGFVRIVSLHDPIKDSNGELRVLHTYRSHGGRWVGASWEYPDVQWFDDGAFAFPCNK